MSINFDYLNVFLLTFARMVSMITFNPVFARRNLPSRIRILLVMGMTLVVAPTIDPTPTIGMTEFEMMFNIVKEIFVGFTLGYVFQIFYYMLFFSGDFLDMQFGLSMAKAFDPNTNIQMSTTGNFFNIYFMLYLFTSNVHLTIIRIFVFSYEVLPLNSPISTEKISVFILMMFSTALVLVMKLAMPFFVAEFVIESTMGVLMKLIPQIHVFVINIQFKILVALFLMMTLSISVGDFLDGYLQIIIQSLQQALYELKA